MSTAAVTLTWIAVGQVKQFPVDSGLAVKVGTESIAVYRYGVDGWFATQNRCPHEGVGVLSRGIVGDVGGEPKVACPLHKNSFSLVDGRHLGGNLAWCLRTYPVNVEDGQVWIGLDAP